MASTSVSASTDARRYEKEENPTLNKMVTNFFMENDDEFSNLERLRSEGWDSKLAQKGFKQDREKAGSALSDSVAQSIFFTMMQHVGDEIETRTKAFSLPGDTRSSGLRVLDLCMAPGGFSASAVKYSQDIISICAITLPHSQGGFKLLFESPLLQIQFQDITMLATEFGATDRPPTHPDRAEVVTDRPFEDESFDLVFCGGQVLRSHSRGPHQEQTEPLRLRVSQLILALQRIKKCGSLVMLMHKADAWDTVKLVHQISRFAAVALIKPKKSHAAKGTFYLVAKNVRPEDDAAKEALVGWKKSWWDATFGGEDGLGGCEALDSEDSVKKLLDEYGKEYAKQVRHVWKIQVDALSQKLEGLRSQTDTLSKQERTEVCFKSNEKH